MLRSMRCGPDEPHRYPDGCPGASTMKPVAFAYAAPRTLDEALALFAQHGDEAKALAGGQSLVPMLNFRLVRPATLIDLNRVAGLANVRTARAETCTLVRWCERATLERDPGDRSGLAAVARGSTARRTSGDPQSGDGRRLGGARRPAGRAPRGARRARCAVSPSVAARRAHRRGRGVLHRLLLHRTGGRRAARRDRDPGECSAHRGRVCRRGADITAISRLPVPP